MGFDVPYILEVLRGMKGDDIHKELGIEQARFDNLLKGAEASQEEEQAIYHLGLKEHLHMLLSSYALPVPTYDFNKDFSDSAEAGPQRLLGHTPAPRSPRGMEGHRLFGRPVRMPIGISASPLTANSKWVSFYAQKGFDVLTYKTVRSNSHPGNQRPHWAFVPQLPHHLEEAAKQLHTPPPVIGIAEYWPEDIRSFSMVNSFGIPSTGPLKWQEDVQRASKSLGTDQILIVSVTGTWDRNIDDPGLAENALVDDYIKVATLAYQATGGHSPIELDLSCPNTNRGMLFKDMQPLCENICEQVRLTLRDAKIIAKIGYLPGAPLLNLVNSLKNYVDGITAINTLPVRVEDNQGQLFFVDREMAGLSGAGVRSLAREVARNLTIWRREGVHDADIISVGGIMSPHDVRYYLNELQVDAVQVCTAALVNPDLALQVRDAYDLLAVS